MNARLFAGLLALVASVSVTGAQTYHVTDLGTLPGQTVSTPAGINNQGLVTGSSVTPRALLFDHGAVQDLGTLPGGSSASGMGINDLGQVSGDSQYRNGGSIRHATLFSNGTRTDLGFLPLSGNYSRGNGINNLTEVVGHSGPSLDTSNTRAFIWDAVNGMRDIGTLGGAFAKAFSINDSSVVTGTAQANSGGFHAFLWDATNGMRDIGTIAGTTSSGNFINANGHVAGTSTINGFDNREHAFLYDGTIHDLGAIGDNDFLSDRSFGYGININDEVVGSTYRPYQGGALFQIAFIYRDGQMFDLETLVDDSGADYRLYSATGINDAGEIAVEAFKLSEGEFHAVLLTPNTANDTVTIKSATYTTAKQTLAVQATSSSTTASLDVFNTSTDALIGPLVKKGAKFVGKFRLPANPGSITVKSSAGGTATATVIVR